MKHSLNAFPLYVKFSSKLKNLKISENIEKTGEKTSLAEPISSLKIDFPQVSMILSTSRKILEWNKKLV